METHVQDAAVAEADAADARHQRFASATGVAAAGNTTGVAVGGTAGGGGGSHGGPRVRREARRLEWLLSGAVAPSSISHGDGGDDAAADASSTPVAPSVPSDSGVVIAARYTLAPFSPSPSPAPSPSSNSAPAAPPAASSAPTPLLPPHPAAVLTATQHPARALGGRLIATSAADHTIRVYALPLTQSKGAGEPAGRLVAAAGPAVLAGLGEWDVRLTAAAAAAAAAAARAGNDGDGDGDEEEEEESAPTAAAPAAAAVAAAAAAAPASDLGAARAAVLSLCWHPQLPLLLAGRANGEVLLLGLARAPAPAAAAAAGAATGAATGAAGESGLCLRLLQRWHPHTRFVIGLRWELPAGLRFVSGSHDSALAVFEALAGADASSGADAGAGAGSGEGAATIAAARAFGVGAEESELVSLPTLRGLLGLPTATPTAAPAAATAASAGSSRWLPFAPAGRVVFTGQVEALDVVRQDPAYERDWVMFHHPSEKESRMLAARARAAAAVAADAAGAGGGGGVDGEEGGWGRSRDTHPPAPVPPPAGCFIVSVRGEPRLFVVHAPSRSIERTIHINRQAWDGHVSFTPLSLATSCKGYLVAVATDKHRVVVYDMARDRVVNTYFGGVNGDSAVPKVAWGVRGGGDMAAIAVSTQDNSVHMWDAARTAEAGTAGAHRLAVRALEAVPPPAPEPAAACTGTGTGAGVGEGAEELEWESPVEPVARGLLTASFDKTVVLWELRE